MTVAGVGTKRVELLEERREFAVVIRAGGLNSLIPQEGRPYL